MFKGHKARIKIGGLRVKHHWFNKIIKALPEEWVAF